MIIVPILIVIVMMIWRNGIGPSEMFYQSNKNHHCLMQKEVGSKFHQSTQACCTAKECTHPLPPSPKNDEADELGTKKGFQPLLIYGITDRVSPQNSVYYSFPKRLSMCMGEKLKSNAARNAKEDKCIICKTVSYCTKENTVCSKCLSDEHFDMERVTPWWKRHF